MKSRFNHSLLFISTLIVSLLFSCTPKQTDEEHKGNNSKTTDGDIQPIYVDYSFVDSNGKNILSREDNSPINWYEDVYVTYNGTEYYAEYDEYANDLFPKLFFRNVGGSLYLRFGYFTGHKTYDNLEFILHLPDGSTDTVSVTNIYANGHCKRTFYHNGEDIKGGNTIKIVIE